MREFWKRLRSTISKPPAEAELDDELLYHLDLQIEQNIRRGMPPHQARREALIAFGGIAQVKERYRDRLNIPSLDSFRQDLRFAWRMLRRSPGFAAIAILTLAIGIAANTAIFSLVDAVILRPLPFPHPDRLMAVLTTTRDFTGPFSSAEGVFLDWRERSQAFESIAGAEVNQAQFAGPSAVRHIQLGHASFDLFSVLGVQPILGRVFIADDSARTALLSEDFWRRELHAAPDVLGRTINLGHGPLRVLGILPSRFRFANFGPVDVWVPFHPRRESRTGGPIIAAARLRPGVTRAAAQAELDSITAQIRREHAEDRNIYPAVRPLAEWMVRGFRQPFFMLWGAVGFVLLICCANVANLLLARAAARQPEMATRSALGASPARLVRQTLMEGALLAALGSVLGILGAFALLLLPTAMPIPRVEEIAINARVLAAALLLATASTLLFCLPHALHIFRRSLNASLRGGERLRTFLVAAQLALALILLSGAGLMTNGLLRLLNIDPGFDRGRVLTVQSDLPFGLFDNRARSYDLFQRLASEVRRIPGVELVTIVENPPLVNAHFVYYLHSDLEDVTGQCNPEGRHVGDQYLAVTGTPLLAGRDFEPGDESRHPVPVILNSGAARALFGAADPIGKPIHSRFYEDRLAMEVIGIAADVRQLELTAVPGPQIYVPAIYGYGRRLLVREAAHAPDLTAPIRAAARRLFSGVAPAEVMPLDTRLSDEVARPRFFMMLLGAFAVTGLLLAGVGVYGVTTYSVVRRTREIGIRIALGAEPSAIRRMILASGLRMTTAGVAIGLAGAFVATPLLSSLLYEVRPNDPLTFACVVALLAAIAMLACYLAARKATTVQPTEALRCE